VFYGIFTKYRFTGKYRGRIIAIANPILRFGKDITL